MKIDSKRIISLLMLMVILISNIAPNIALAIDGTPNISVTVSSATLQRGETFTATVEFDNNGSNDCIGISYALQFDSNVLEVINVQIEPMIDLKIVKYKKYNYEKEYRNTR